MGFTLLLTIAAVAAAGAGLGPAALVARAGGGPWTGRALGVALATAAMVTVGVAAVLVLQMGGVGFAVVHAAYLAVTLTVPLVAAGVLVAGARRGGTRGARVAAGVLLVPAAVGAYATHVEPRWLRVDHVEVAVAAERAGEDEVRIAVLADLQASGVGAHERRAVQAVLDARPDVVLIPGDLFQGSEGQWEAHRDEMRALLRRLHAPGGVFYVQGDVDGGGRSRWLLAGSGITVLDDEVAETRVGDRTVRIGGTRLAYDGPGADRVRAELGREPEDGALTILLSHRPDTVLRLPEGARVDLTVAGHTHGGQVVVPGFGPLLTLSEVPRDVARGGRHEVAGNPVYVSPGVGLEREHAPQVRLGNRPAVAVLTLRDAR